MSTSARNKLTGVLKVAVGTGIAALAANGVRSALSSSPVGLIATGIYVVIGGAVIQSGVSLTVEGAKEAFNIKGR